MTHFFAQSNPGAPQGGVQTHPRGVKAVVFRDLSCWLGAKKILSGLSGEIFAGRVTAILGPNGCGKSTFLRALLGLVPVEGKVSKVENAGYMPQAKEIYWPLTCEAIIHLQAGGPRPEARGILERMGIEHLMEKRIDEVSGGERTLVLLARALLSQPQMIILDEPVSELDPAYQIRVMKILQEEAKRGALVLTTMHDIHLTQHFCDDVFLMRDGEIFQRGAVQTTLTIELLNQLFKVSFQKEIGFYAK